MIAVTAPRSKLAPRPSLRATKRTLESADKTPSDGLGDGVRPGSDRANPEAPGVAVLEAGAGAAATEGRGVAVLE